MKVRAFREWLDQKIAEDPTLQEMELGYVDIGRGAWFTGLTLTIREHVLRDGTVRKEAEIDGP